jgi:cell wall assembly regulator SMI1
MTSITWTPYVWNHSRPASKEDISALEKLWGVSLPADYKEVIIAHQGDTPSPECIAVRNGETNVTALLTIGANTDKPEYSMQSGYETIKDEVPPGIIPFAISSGGKYFCFDYRHPGTQPKIVFWVPEEEEDHGLIFVASNFSEFLDALH